MPASPKTPAPWTLPGHLGLQDCHFNWNKLQKYLFFGQYSLKTFTAVCILLGLGVFFRAENEKNKHHISQLFERRQGTQLFPLGLDILSGYCAGTAALCGVKSLGATPAAHRGTHRTTEGFCSSVFAVSRETVCQHRLCQPSLYQHLNHLPLVQTCCCSAATCSSCRSCSPWEGVCVTLALPTCSDFRKMFLFPTYCWFSFNHRDAGFWSTLWYLFVPAS